MDESGVYLEACVLHFCSLRLTSDSIMRCVEDLSLNTTEQEAFPCPKAALTKTCRVMLDKGNMLEQLNLDVLQKL